MGKQQGAAQDALDGPDPFKEEAGDDALDKLNLPPLFSYLFRFFPEAVPP